MLAELSFTPTMFACSIALRTVSGSIVILVIAGML